MTQSAITDEQMTAILKNLPADCVYSAVQNVEPEVPVGLARFFLLECEHFGVITWDRQSPSQIKLTEKGEKMLAGEKE